MEINKLLGSIKSLFVKTEETTTTAMLPVEEVGRVPPSVVPEFKSGPIHYELNAEIFYIVDGKEYCDEEKALAILLAEEVCFVNERDYVHPISWTEGKIQIAGSTTIVFVICNDLFYWGTADAEDLPHDEIGKLFKMWYADKRWGPDKWCCFRRNLRPQVPIVKMMKEAGVWDDAMEALPAPAPS
jgi:hypothetical protein